MIAFAGNSILCRLALAHDTIDPASFTVIRLVAGAVTLIVILAARTNVNAVRRSGSWRSAITLFIYAIAFSLAYVQLDTAAGALILFGTAQATMISAALLSGERPIGSEYLGWIAAVGGFIWLLLPGATTPPLSGALLMTVAGVGWGLYSLYGRDEPAPLAGTAGNFLRVMLPTALLALVALSSIDISSRGALLAALSGSITTGVGYVIWYAALPKLSSLQAALVQLSVPAIAALGGVLVVTEALSARIVVAGLLITGGICIAIAGRYRHTKQGI
ncbi:MAG: DMT family transporter [Pseudomonadota bacterium]